MIQIGSGNNSKLQARVPYWNLPYYKDMDIVFDATKGGFLNKPNYGNDLASLVTDTHTSTIMAPNSAGIYSNFGPNSLVRTDLGLQTVPTRTNLVRNSAGNGSVNSGGRFLPTFWAGAGNANGITITKVDEGVEFGLPYAEFTATGTSTGGGGIGLNFDTAQLVGASEVRNASFFYNFLSTTGLNSSITLGIQEFNGTTSIYPSTAASRQAGFTRIQWQRTTAADAITGIPYMTIQPTGVGVVVDARFRIYCPQYEVGVFASSPILTTGTAATVAGNQQVITGLGPSLVTGVAGFVDLDLLGLPSSGQFPRLFQFDNGNTQNRICLVVNGTSNIFLFEVWNNNISQANINLGTSSIGRNCFAFIATENYVIARKVGDVQRPIDNSVSYPIVNDRFSLSGESFTSNNNTYKYTKKSAIRFLKPGDNPETVFSEVFAQAQLAHAA